MAITEKYVAVVAAGAADGSTINDPMDWATLRGATWMAKGDASLAGTRFNVQAGTYVMGAADTWTSDGTATSPIILRGCDASWNPITPTRTNGNGALITTNMPFLDYSGGNWRIIATASDYIIFQGFRISSAGSGNALDLGGQCLAYGCQVTNSSNNSSAACIRANSANSTILDCDAILSAASGPTSGAINLSAAGTRCIGCHVQDSPGIGIDMTALPSFSINNVIFNHDGYGIYVANTTTSGYWMIIGNTIYGGKGISTANVAYTALSVILNNHVTDITEVGEYAFTNPNVTGSPVVLGWNRTRDINTGVTSWAGDWPTATTWNHVTTDTGGASTDYVNAPSNLNLIPKAPGKSSGLPLYMDIGGVQSRDLSPGSNTIDLTGGLDG